MLFWIDVQVKRFLYITRNNICNITQRFFFSSSIKICDSNVIFPERSENFKIQNVVHCSLEILVFSKISY